MRMMANLVFKARLEYYMDRAGKRLKEKVFDKISQWGLLQEERREVLSEIIIRQMAKRGF